MDSELAGRPVTTHTLASLCTALIKGEPILLSDEAAFHLPSDDARRLLGRLMADRKLWQGQCRTDDVKGLCRGLVEGGDVPLPTSGPIRGVAVRRLWRLKSLSAQCFAGLTPYGSDASEDNIFSLSFPDGPCLTLLEGKNGAGKTSLINAITWCLTGYVYRAHQAPVEAGAKTEAFPIWSMDDIEEEDGQTRQAKISPVTPLPAKEDLGETWRPNAETCVELEFVPVEGGEAVKVRRTLRYSTRGVPHEVAPDLSTLGIDPMGLEVGTRLPGLIPHIAFDGASPLSAAVAELTGISPLKRLASYATKAKGHLKGRLSKEARGQMVAAERRYGDALKDYKALTDAHSSLPLPVVPSVAAEDKARHTLKEAQTSLEALDAEAFKGAREVLGEGFDPADPQEVRGLRRDIILALRRTDSLGLAELSGMKKLKGLKDVDGAELSALEDLIATLLEEARALEELEANPERAHRLRLYARLADWVGRAESASPLQERCLLCHRDLNGVEDPVLGGHVQAHIHRALEEPSIARFAMQEWGRDSLHRLNQTLPRSFRPLEQGLKVGDPKVIYRGVLVEELLGDRSFHGVLAPLRDAMGEHFDVVFADLGQLELPTEVRVPERVGAANPQVEGALLRTLEFVAYCRWRAENGAKLRSAFRAYLGTKTGSPSGSDVEPPDPSLRGRLGRLERVVEHSQPIAAARERLEALAEEVGRHEKASGELLGFARGAEAFVGLETLRGLVDGVVGGLMTQLGDATKVWRDKLYKPAYTGGPQFQDCRLGASDALEMRAGAHGIAAPLHQISNASALRASLLAFLLAFRAHLLAERGGLSLLLLDDPQELFDPENRKLLTGALRELRRGGVQLIVTTNDPAFVRNCDTLRGRSEGPNLLHRTIRPASAEHGPLRLEHTRRDLDATWGRLRGMQINDHEAAENYMSELRIYLEQRVSDFFQYREVYLPKQSGLGKYLQNLRELGKKRMPPFEQGSMKQLLNQASLRPESTLWKLWNQAHHKDSELITYREVIEQEEEIRTLLTLVETASLEFEAWALSAPTSSGEARAALRALPDPPESLTPPSKAIASVASLAALGADEMLPDGEDEALPIQPSWFDQMSVYYIRADTLGLTAPKGCRVLVRNDDTPIRSGRLVIALHREKVYARRCHRERGTRQLALVPEVLDPRVLREAVFCDEAEVRILKIVGVLFDTRPAPAKSKEEAMEDLGGSAFLRQAQLAFKVSGSSAMPIALDRQSILGGAWVSLKDVSEGDPRLFAIDTTDGAFLKRIGAKVGEEDRLRILNRVGAFGEALTVWVGTEEDAPKGVAVVRGAREILGVLFDQDPGAPAE